MKLFPLGLDPSKTSSEGALFQHYEGLDFVAREMSRGTLSLMAALESHPGDRVLYGQIVGPYSKLHLHSQNDENSPTWLKIAGLGMDHMIIHVRVPVERRRFPDCWVEREVESQGDGFEMVVEGLDYSNGWDASIGDLPIGLSEMVMDGLSDFTDSKAERFRECLKDWRKERRPCPISGHELSLVVLGEMKNQSLLAYRPGGMPNRFRWGVLPSSHDDSVQDGTWYSSFQEAFQNLDDA